jgi:hypothetical protein
MKNLYKIIVMAILALPSVNISAQTTVHLENFDASSALPAIVVSNDGDWHVDASSSCTVVGSSGNNYLMGDVSGVGLQEIVLGPFNMSAYSTMLITWNGYRSISPVASPSVTLQYSTAGPSTGFTSVAFTDVVADGAWHALSTITMPAAACGISTYIKLSYNYGVPFDYPYIAFDDFLVQGNVAGTYYSKATGNLDLLSTWGDITDGTGTPPANFISNSQVFNVSNRTSATIGAAWAIAGSNTQLHIGDGVTDFVDFTIPAAFALNFSSSSDLIVANGSTLTLNNTVMPAATSVSLSTGSTVVYNQSSSVNLIAKDHYNLTISGGANKSMTSTMVIDNILNLNGSNFIAAPSSVPLLSINGTIIGSGAIQTTSSSKVVIGGSGALGTLTFSSTTLPIICGALTLNRTGGSIVLGSDLKVNGAFTQTNGSLDISGKLLTLNGAITFPSSSTNGVILGSATSSISITGTGAITNSLFMDAASKSLYDLTLNRTGGNLTIGSSLNILNSITPTLGTLNLNGMVTLKSTNTKKARVGIVGGAISGNLTVETFIPGGVAGWNILGPAGVSGLSVSNWDGGSGSATSIAMTCNGCTYDEYAAGGYFVSIQTDVLGTGVTFTELTSGSALTPGFGYWVYVASSLSSAIDITQTTSGGVVSGPQSSSNGLKSNPYPSPISVSNLQSHNGSLSSVDVYNASGAYTSFNGGLPSDVIPMGQGFYANGVGAGSLSFVETDKISGDASMLKTSEATTAIGSVFQLQLTGAYDSDLTYLRFHNTATTNFDRTLDAYKRYSTPGYLGYPGAYTKYTTIATVNSSQDYAINSLPYVTTSSVSIPVVAKVSTTGQYTISPIDISNLALGVCVTLRDKLLGVNHDLRTGSYICNINDTTSAARFELKICADPSVGVEEVSQSESSLILINQDGNGAYVNTKFESNTKATISAYNMMGQKIMEDKEVEGKQNTTYLNLNNVHSQVVVIRVTTAKESSVKKLFIN